MSAARRARPGVGLPALTLGASAAMAAEVAAGLLLYEGPGLVRSLTTVLSVEATALALGLWTVPRSGSRLADSLRRRWMLCLAAFLAATMFAASWSLVRDIGSRALGQGLGLAVLGGLPLYSAGAVLAALSAGDDGERGGRASVAGPAAFGAAVGFLFTGVSLTQVVTPASLFLTSLILLSAGGLVSGALLDRPPSRRVVAAEPSTAGPLRVEERGDADERGVKVILENGRARGWQPVSASGWAPWEVAAFDALRRRWEELGVAEPRIVLVGGGASLLPRTAVRAHPGVRVTVLEENPELVELALGHLETGMPAGTGERTELRIGGLADLLDELAAAQPGSAEAVLLDARAFGPGPLRLSRRTVADLERLLAPDGAVIAGPVDRTGELRGRLDLEWALWRRTLPAWGAALRDADGLDGQGPDAPGGEPAELVWVGRRAGPALEGGLAGFSFVRGERIDPLPVEAGPHAEGLPALVPDEEAEGSPPE